ASRHDLPSFPTRRSSDLIITFDVGGTSTDVSLISGGRPSFTSDRLVAGHPVKMPMVDIHVVGAGGGSIARLDEVGALKDGPRSRSEEHTSELQSREKLVC